MESNGIEPKNAKLAKAKVAAWGEISAVVGRNAKNPHLKNEYADLSAVMQAVKPVLAKHGLAFEQIPGSVADGKLTLLGVLTHESGEREGYQSEIVIGSAARKKQEGDEDKPGAVGPQQIVSAVTYLRRTQLKAVFGLADGDDDGEVAQGSEPAAGEYPGGSSALLEAIKATKETDELEVLKPAVESTGDDSLIAEFMSQRRKLKQKGKL